MSEPTLNIPISFLESQTDNVLAKDLLNLWNIHKRQDNVLTKSTKTTKSTKIFRKCSKCGIADGHNKTTCKFIPPKKVKKKKQAKEIISDCEVDIKDIFIDKVKYILYADNSVTNYNYVTVGTWDGKKIDWKSNTYELEHKQYDDYSAD